MEPQPVNGADGRLAKLAANQHGVVSLAQLRGLGFSKEAAKSRVRAGRLHRVHRGVYAVGHLGLSPEGLWMAAALALGPRAVISHLAAAALWKLLPWKRGAVDVTVPPGGRSDRAGIRIHRSRTLLPIPGVRTPTTLRLNIPVTTPTRTLADLERCVPAQHLARAHRQAEVLGLPLEEASTASAAPHTELERRFLALCRRHRLPEPEVNVPVGAYLPDFLWRDARLIAETDGYAFHSGRANFEHDRRRAAALAAAGYELLRFTWWQVTAKPDEVAAALRARLGARTTPTPESARPA